MSSDTNALLSAQLDIHGRISRTADNLKKLGSANITLSAIETRLRIMDQLWEKFEAQHELIRACYKESYKESEYVKSDLFDKAENTYVHQRSLLSAYADALKPASPPAFRDGSSEPVVKTALPRIKLPPFSGAYEDWPTFRALFLSVIGSNSTLSNVEKLHYLRSCVQGPAEKLIQSLAVTEENYERAWTLLSKHFENKRELIRSNFAAFTSVAKMKGDTAEELSRIYHAVTTAVNAQESINRPIESHGMDLFNFLIIEQFDSKTRLEWESSVSDSREPADNDVLMEFISKRILTLNAAKPKSSAKNTIDSPRSVKSHFTKHGNEKSLCALCKGGHSIMHCSDFKAKSANERRSIIDENRLCFNCFGNHPVARCQSTRNCLTCKSRHHSMLHDAYTTPKSTEVSALAAARHNRDCKATLLATARVLIADRFGDSHAVRVLIDQGSEVSLVSEALVQRLHLKRERSEVSIVGIGGVSSGATRGKTSLKLISQVTGTELSVVAIILPRLSLYEGTSLHRTPGWSHIQGLPLADPQYYNNDPVELLLGAEVCSAIFQEGLRRGDPRAPLAQQTTLGWILSGGCSAAALHARCSLQYTADYDLAALVQRFWEQEEGPAPPVALTPEEQRCEDHFVQTHERTPTGRYQVRLPFSMPPPPLTSTRHAADRMLFAMEKRFRQDPQFGRLYRAFMQEYEDLKHMEEVTHSSEHHICSYLPHHGVCRESSTTTKVRVVFNGSQRSNSGNSLNAYLLVGKNLLPALSDVLLRWRRHRFAFVADVEKMYRQILVTPEDRNFQRILWRQTTVGAVREYRLNTVTYGLACAPFLALRTLRQLSFDEEATYPRGAIALRQDSYVDDVVTGADTLADAIALQEQLRGLCTAGGFPLRKWAANDAKVLTGIPSEYQLHQIPHLWEDECHSTLGLRWHPSEDTFSFTIHPRATTECTKRNVLAESARLFDPLGWLAPVTMRAKILIQSAWLQRLDWDTPLADSDVQLWKAFLTELPLLESLRIPRWLGCDLLASPVELHGFADASERGYAAVVYLRVCRSNSTSLTLLAAKSKVAPVKQVSLPRLELCAAALLTSLMEHLRSCLHLLTAPTFLWSDSTVTLHWIRGHASRWKTYVANRVSLIQQRLPDAQWRHVPGPDNPADCASRGIAPSDLVSHNLWWRGPAWLLGDQGQWPAAIPGLSDEELPERKVAVLLLSSQTVAEPELLVRFSALHSLLRFTALSLRWRRSLDHSVEKTPRKFALVISPTELDEALLHWIKVVQTLYHNAERRCIKDGRAIPQRSSLSKLQPFLDDAGILRVGGRLKHSLLAYDERHPVIMPSASWLTRLLVESCHKKTLHGGVQLTLGSLRARFWILRGRAVVKRLLHRCVTCTRWRAATPQPLMGNLPRGRVTPARPFIKTGVDYAGPIMIRSSKGRGQKAHKAFIAVFVCLCSRAVHLEIASDYSTNAFLAAFRRFISRRGLCTDVFSDCGTNFVGADRALRELLRASSSSSQVIARTLATDGITWHFNPPAAPHFGGLWEAAVKSTKHHLKRVIGEATLTFEEMTTLLAQIEACLNSRPLQALSDDPDDISALTPGHFLIGAPLQAVPAPQIGQDNLSASSRWQLVQRMRDHFWSRWSREYIHGLILRPKWVKGHGNPRIGDLCLLKSETAPPTRWPLARIVGVHPGDDGVVRVVTVKTPTSVLTRPVVKLVLLPRASDAPDND